ncbi:MAG: hypothetical protein LBT93_08215 [Treponema sp.]|nr:hypothetical protein [Treponema sp.]
MYVAGERLHQYARDAAGKPVWDNPLPQQPRGKIIGLAATDNQLYALTGELGGAALYKKDKNADVWMEVKKHPDYPNLQNIYGDGTRLFVGARDGTAIDKYVILYDRGGELIPLKNGTKLLAGAVLEGSNHLIATHGGGIFVISDSAMVFPQNPIPETEGKSFAGLIHTGSTVVAVSRNGGVYSGNAGGFTEKISGDLTFTGALALGTTGNGSALLLLGVQGGKGAGGYREILLSDNPWKLRTPGEDQPSSVLNTEKYHSSIANHPVNYIFQVPAGLDSAMTLFASTQKDGLWSYRKRGDEWQWNREP